jgi:transposase
MENQGQNQMYRWILGLLISVESLNAFMISTTDEKEYCTLFHSNLAGFRDLKEWTQQRGCKFNADTLSCIGHTGINTRELVQYLLSQEVEVWLESVEQIKRKMGTHREKSEKMDAECVARYALLHQNQASIVNLTGSSLEKLRDLQGNRSRLVQAIQILQLGTQALKKVDADSGNMLESVNREALRGLEKSLEQAEKKISRYVGSLKLSLRKRA